MKHKKPDHCAGCIHHHKACHPKCSRLHGSRFDNWCCKYRSQAAKAVGRRRLQGVKQTREIPHHEGAGKHGN